MEEKYRKRMEWLFAEYTAESEVDHYLELFPELDGRLSKFAVGIFQWNLGKEIDINNPNDVSKVRMILKVLDQSPAYGFFNESFNECDPDVVCEILGIRPRVPREEPEVEIEYSITPVKTFKEANEYKEAVSWCIVISEEAFEEYTKKGNRFYFLENKGWCDAPSIPGRNFPHDRFGYSLIAVEVSAENKIVSVTSRWNESGENSGNFLTENRLRDLLGKSYNELFI